MMRISEIKCAPIAGINVLALIGVDVLLVKQDIGVDTVFTAYIGNVYYTEQKVAKTAFIAMVKEFKQVAKNVSIEEKLNQLRYDENVCTVYSKQLDYDSIDTDKLISATRALVEIEKPFNNDEDKGNIKDVLELWE